VLLKFLCMVECIKMQSDISLMASNNHLFFHGNDQYKTKNKKLFRSGRRQEI
jgi:hypothetical protein